MPEEPTHPKPVRPPAPPMPDPTGIRSTDGVELAVYDPVGAHPGSGPSRAPADRALRGAGRYLTPPTDALLAHANGFCAGVMAPLARELAPWRCVAFDARAHGRSTVPRGDMAWEGHRDDVLAVLDGTGLDRPVGIGHSMGGAALLLAEQHRPGTFRALWLFEPIVFPTDLPSTGDNPLEAGALRRRERFHGRDAAYANFASKPPLDELSAECLAAYVEHGFDVAPDGTAVLRCSPEDEAAGYRMGVRHRGWDRLRDVGCPVVVARGAEHTSGPAGVAPAIAQRLPRGRLEEHPELGHFGPLADPPGVAASVRALAAGA